MERPFVVGQSVTRTDALEKVTVKARLGEELALLRTLHAKIFKSTCPHARTTTLDASKVRSLSSVRAVITEQHFPNLKWGRLLEDKSLIDSDRARFIAEPRAVLAAERFDIAEEAMRPNPPFILHPDTQTYFQLLIPIMIVAPEPDLSNVFSHLKVRKKDVEKAFEKADENQLAATSAITPSKIRVIAPHLGQGFGGKSPVFVSPPAALLAQKMGGLLSWC